MLGIILINYNSEEEVVHYIKYELSKIALPSKIVIVNNSDTSASNNYFIKELNASVVKDNSVDLNNRIYLFY
jgi:hypothetical protein